MYTQICERFLNVLRKTKFQLRNVLGLRHDNTTALCKLLGGKDIIFDDRFDDFDNWITFDPWDTVLPNNSENAVVAKNSVITNDGAQIQIWKRPTVAYKHIKVGDEWKKIYETRPYGSGHIFCKHKFGKGRYIAVVKYPDFRMSWACFWVYTATADYIQEMDIGEHMYFNDNDRNILPFYCHTGDSYDPGAVHNMIGTKVRGVKHTQQYVVLHMDWTDKYIECGIDGIPIFRTYTDKIIHPMQPRFTSNVSFRRGVEYPDNSIISTMNIKSFTYLKL